MKKILPAIPHDAPRPSRRQNQEGCAARRMLSAPSSQPHGQGSTAPLRGRKPRGRDEAESTYIQISDHAGRSRAENRATGEVDFVSYPLFFLSRTSSIKYTLTYTLLSAVLSYIFFDANRAQKQPVACYAMRFFTFVFSSLLSCSIRVSMHHVHVVF